MRIALLSSLAAIAVVPGLCTLSLHESDSPRILRLGLTRNRHHDPVGRDRRRFKRQTVDVDLYGDSNGGDIYSANLTLGDPPQPVEVSVDTGSSDLWVVYTHNDICSAQGARCDSLGTYDPQASRSSDSLSDRFSIQYGDTSQTEGYYVVDTLTIEDAELPQAQFGVSTSSSIDKGILGIGYSANVASDYAYPNIPELLAQNITSSNAYSLWLNRLGQDEGNILFGGVNTAHYTGELQTVPVIPYNNDYIHLWVALTDMGVESASDEIQESFSTPDSSPIAVLLDSGATLTYLPAALVAEIYNALDVHFFEQEQLGYVPCTSYLTDREDYHLTFTFSGLTIRVPLRELVLQDALYYSDDSLHINGEQSCVFGILPAANFFPILGDSFLRSAYVVFDLDNNEISMAQANYEPGDDHILEIGSGDDPVPDATDVPDPVTNATPTPGPGSSLSLPPDHTNEPIFPSRTSSSSTTTTTGVDASTTADVDSSLPTESGSDGTATDASGSAADPEETGGAMRSGPSWWIAGVAGVCLLLRF